MKLICMYTREQDGMLLYLFMKAVVEQLQYVQHDSVQIKGSMKCVFTNQFVLRGQPIVL